MLFFYIVHVIQSSDCKVFLFNKRFIIYHHQFLSFLYGYGALLGSPLGHQSSAINPNQEELLCFRTGAIALLDHSNQILSQHHPDLVRPSWTRNTVPCVRLTFQSLGNYLEMNSSRNSTVSRLWTKLATLLPLLLVAAFMTNLAITTKMESLF